MGLYNLVKTKIEGCFEIETRTFKDERGAFIKVYHEEEFKSLGLPTHFEEEYISISRKNVLRGLHFQLPPHQHAKLVACLNGKILDVVVDLRKNSNTYGTYHSVELSSENNKMLYVPEGLAHGFYAYTENAIFLSMNSYKFNAESDSGIKWNSFDFNWPNKNPILSEKDENLIELKHFKTPF